MKTRHMGDWTHRGRRFPREVSIPSPDGTDLPFVSVPVVVNASDDPDDPRETLGGHTTSGCGFTIAWQDTLHGEGGKCRRGATCEEVLAAVVDRLEVFQGLTSFPCSENAEAADLIREAIDRLHSRTRDRMMRKVEGQNEA